MNNCLKKSMCSTQFPFTKGREKQFFVEKKRRKQIMAFLNAVTKGTRFTYLKRPIKCNYFVVQIYKLHLYKLLSIIFSPLMRGGIAKTHPGVNSWN